ncbi:MAG TPA: hypothetical protein VGK02_06315 [Candidatus Aquicultor sp.]|jgi:hypothetical protein
MATYSGYDFTRIKRVVVRTLFKTIFDVTSGHNHDGTNSKAVTVGTVADDAITTAKINALAVTEAKLAAGAVTTVKITDANVTLAKLAASAKAKTYRYQVEDLAAGADIAARCILSAPTGIDITLTSAKIIPQGAAAGVDDANTSVWALTDGTNTIVTDTYDTAPGFPAANAVTSLGTLDSTYKVLSAGEKLYLTVTNGATANLPGVIIEITYTEADAA